MKRCTLTSAIAAVMFLSFASARADTALTFTEDGTSEASSADQTIGWAFTVSANISVTKLGFYDPAAFLNDSHPVGIWDSNGQLVLQATVPSGSGSPQGDFRYVDVPATPLPPGDYVIGALYYGNHPDLFNGVDSSSSLSAAPQIASVVGRWVHGATLALPSNIAGTPAYLGPNFQFTAGGGGPAENITLNQGGATDLEVVVRDTQVSFLNQIEDLLPTSLPYDQSETATQGASRSEAEYHLSQDTFRITTSGARSGLLDSRANVQPQIYFSVSAETPYAISGTLTVDNPGSDGRYAGLFATLTDVDTSEVLFNSSQESFNTPDQTFTLGELNGNLANDISGSPTGVLLAGHRYNLFYGTSIYANSGGDPASFTGTFEIRFTAANQPPICNAGADQVVQVHANTATVQLNGSGSSDPDGDALTFQWSVPAESGATIDNPASAMTTGSFPVGQTFASLTVTDAQGASSTCQVLIDVQLLNQPPAANAGPDLTVEAQGGLTSVQLDASLSSDPDGDALDFDWSAPSGSGVVIDDPHGAVTTGHFPLGPTLLTLTVSDGLGGVSVADVLVTVEDTTPPVVVCTTDKISLWPPDHSMQDAFVVIQASDTYGDPATLSIQCSARSSELDDSGGDGSTTGDVNGGDGYSAPQPVALTYNSALNRFEGTLQLRAERAGNHSSRVYSIAANVTDISGNTSTASCVVIVPHDGKKN